MARSILGGIATRDAGAWNGIDRWRYHREARSSGQHNRDWRRPSREGGVSVWGKPRRFDLCQWSAGAGWVGSEAHAQGARESEGGSETPPESSLPLGSYRIGNVARQAPSGFGD